MVAGPELPDRAELPAERSSDRLERRRVDLDRLLGFREDPSDVVLDALEIALVGDSTGMSHRR